MNDTEFAADALVNWDSSSDDDIADELRAQTKFSAAQIAAILAQRSEALCNPVYFRLVVPA